MDAQPYKNFFSRQIPSPPQLSPRELIRVRLEKLNSIPTVPAIIRPLIHYMDKPIEQVDVKRVVDMVSCDEAITAQCLRMANSALYFRSQDVRTVHGAVIILGVQQVREILMACSLLHLLPKGQWTINPSALWKHSLGCAVVSRQFARRLRYPEPDKAYLAGLLHDLGQLVNFIALPSEYQTVLEKAVKEKCALHVAESAVLGFNHCESGRIVAVHWKLNEELVEVIQHHHDPQQARLQPGLAAIVSLSDQFCRRVGLGLGYEETFGGDLLDDSAWEVLALEFPRFGRAKLEEYSSEILEFARNSIQLVDSLFPA
ncbi:MAG TPA: HDOD domain-containing protein [Candidatus Sulfotelmatobacter sp.]|nr:HDOD domain-containing protein [Candidatus Sulfotelmatobacter sp.]